MGDNKVASNGKSEFQREADMQQAIENIDATQNALDGLNDQASEEILKIESKYNKQRAPLYKKRAEVLAQIPNFWHHVLTSHPQIVSTISEEEDECLQYLTNVYVHESDDIKSGYKLEFTFDSAKNPFFTNETLEKVITVNPGGKITTTCSQILWKQGKELVSADGKKKDGAAGDGKKKAEAESGDDETAAASFFNWLVNWPFPSPSAGSGAAEGAEGEDDGGMDGINDLVDIGDVIKEDIWPNPLSLYLANDEDDDMDDDEEDEDEESDFDEEGADAETGPTVG